MDSQSESDDESALLLIIWRLNVFISHLEADMIQQ